MLTSAHSQFVYSFFSLAEKYSSSESSSSIFRLVTRKECDLQLCLDVKAARSWKKTDQTRYGGCRKCAVSLFQGTCTIQTPDLLWHTPTVQNYPFVGFWKVLYLRTNTGVVVGKIERNLKPRVLVAVAEPSMQSPDEISNFCTIDSSH